MDFFEAVVDEIALEGLDGITIATLWLRLEDRRPKFPFSLDNTCKQFLWNRISVHPDLKFYELPEERPTVVIWDRWSSVEKDSEICVQQSLEEVDPYPVQIIDKGGIQGSCSTFTTRTDITFEIRDDEKSLCTLEKAIERWGNKLVIVASQEIRIAALFGAEHDPNWEFVNAQYCLLERIGRSRWNGAATIGTQNLLQVFRGASGHLYYVRKSLLRHGFIMRQGYLEKCPGGRINNGRLFHLKRFYQLHKPRSQVILESAAAYLEAKPGNWEVTSVLIEKLNLDEAGTRTFWKFCSNYIKSKLVPYRDVYPEATEEEYMAKNKMVEKSVRIYTLVKPLKVEEEEEDDVEEPEVEASATQLSPLAEEVLERSMLHIAYRLILSRGLEGISVKQVSSELGIPQIEARALLKALVKKELIFGYFVEVQKTKKNMFVSNVYKEQYHEQKKLKTAVKYEPPDEEGSKAILMAYRKTPGIATGFSPYFLLHGREMRTPFDVKMAPKDKLPNSIREYVQDHLETLEWGREQAKKNKEMASTANKKHYDKKAKNPTFQIGDEVLLHVPKPPPGLSSKLHKKWQGPYRIHQRVGPVTYRIRKCDNNEMHRSPVHANNLREYHEPIIPQQNRPQRQRCISGQTTTPVTSTQQGVVNEEEDDPVRQIEKLVKCSWNAKYKQYQYNVKFANEKSIVKGVLADDIPERLKKEFHSTKTHAGRKRKRPPIVRYQN
ncbi:general transcription factor 3C polypeptide 1-like [Lingula anatina]|uniref:General transcription factor 3C polypeptide 1-like n=1 Tax=Lingula anatina TaxID=7574 RepID=A0A1S3HFH8_LINAN|nr:general transcription factor 3C polypeptide 1-like [Lingula anatina]|eukprot:XP_013384833.1 general transcription factor 3C polypeptide 1-like [Lingula anatina]